MYAVLDDYVPRGVYQDVSKVRRKRSSGKTERGRELIGVFRECWCSSLWC